MLAPSTFAESYSSSGIAFNPAKKVMIANGRALHTLRTMLDGIAVVVERKLIELFRMPDSVKI
jgi:hypothetical protein